MVPIVLQHGLFGFGEFELGRIKLSYFHKIDRALAERGHPVIVSRVHPTGSIERRATRLKRTIRERSDQMGIKDRVVILAHSMGGLDARYMVQHLGMADRVSAIITVATPHRGSPYADWCLLNIGKRLGGLKLMRLLRFDVDAVNDLTITACARFNEQVPDHPDVRYYSISAARAWRHIPPFLLHSYKLIYDLEGDNDGLVSVKSAQWGQHLETWPADHLHVINKRVLPEFINPTGDIVPYYLRAVEQVVGKGKPESRNRNDE